MSVDMHMHTTASDGMLKPTELIQRCAQRGLRIVCVSDHDTTSGLVEAMEEARKWDIRIVPAIEINTDVRRDKDILEVHVLGYFIDYQQKWFQDKLATLREGRENRIDRMLEQLQKAGIDIPRSEVEKHAQGQSIGRPHIALAMVERGIVKDVNQAFDRYLTSGKPGFVPRMHFEPEEAVAMIAAAGGLPVLAHPGLIGDDSLIPPLIDAGLKGLEVYHPNHDADMQRRYLQMARDRGIGATGGSDYHGSKVHAGSEPGCTPFSVSQFEAFCAINGRDPVFAV
ncbi:MAG: PHP domain-containing protein [Candidatus Xenobia bacterium]